MAGTRVSDVSPLTLMGISEIFNKAMKRARKIDYVDCVREVSEEKEYGLYQTLGALAPASKKAEGSAITFSKIETDNQTSIRNETRSNGVECSLEAQEYDLYNVVRNTFGDPLVNTMIDLKEETVADQYNDAFTNTGADGVAILATTHPLHNNIALTNSNLITGALTPDNLIIGKNAFNSIYTQSGKKFPTRPTHLLIHPNKLFTALAILGSALVAYQLSNTKNTVNDVMPVKIITNNYLDYTVASEVSPWFLLDKSLEAGCVLQKKRGMSLKTWWENNDLTYKGIAYEMYGVGITAPGYGIVGSAG